MTPRVWTCQRMVAGVKCSQPNQRIKQKCARCGGKRPKARKPAHLAALESMTYEQAVEAFGERCGICGAGRGTRRLHRDHEHKGAGKVRGLLCFRCNTALPNRVDAEWLRAAADYLERAA